MARLSQTEFAGECRVSTGYISVYIKRKKVFVDENGLIDMKDERNQTFMNKCQARKAPLPTQEEQPPINQEPEAVTVSDDTNPATPTQVIQSAASKKPKGSDGVLKFKENLAIDTEKKAIDVDILRMKRDKLRGDVIPTDVVKQAVTRIFAGLSSSIKQGSENWLTEISKRVGLNRNQIAELRGELIKIINESMDKAVEESKSSISHIVSEYRKDT